MIRVPGDVHILRHPTHACVPARHTVVLSVHAEGAGTLQYQWFNYVQKEEQKQVCEVPGATRPSLTITVTRSQNYSCRVSDVFLNCKFTQWARVTVLDVDQTAPVPLDWGGEPHIALHPRPQTLRPGARLTLRCAAYGVPQPRHQWYRNGAPLNQTREVLQVKQVGVQDAGTYLCSVSSVLGETWSLPADVHIILPKPSVEETPAALTATDKVALLIGNLNYAHLRPLTAPVVDVHELGLLLQQMDFRVLSLLDLTAQQMSSAVDNFIQLLDTGVYGLFYYAGHGFERAGRNYLVPIDAPQPYNTSTCVCVQRIMGKMQEKNTALSVILLDACRTWRKEESLPSVIQPLRATGNTVYGYATCEDAEAFEIQDQGKSTGIFTKYLNKHILLPEKVTHVLERVSEDVDKDALVKGKQAVEVRHTLKEARSLSDPLLSSGHTRELHLRDVCWRRANDLPQKKSLKFPCGAEVEVGFSALFSNVLMAFASVRRSEPHLEDVSVALSSTPVMEDIFSGECRSEEWDSLVFSSSPGPGCSVRLCGLQTLQECLVLKVDLHFTVLERNSVRRCSQSLQLNLGRPLVSSCGLGRKAESPKPLSPKPLSPKPLSPKPLSPKPLSPASSSPASSSPASPSPASPGHYNISHHKNQRTRTFEPCSRKPEGLTRVRRNKPEEHDEDDIYNFIHLK
ncbi:mucosa-associated lymphoid tissue lymphoma translocation protein 1 isoform X2 [Periophthalmus magnuspinnatus]|uniref:mucosa-associated lymphoid tissue lymphoma translocation protein 1 isoform X2 n=1 Tax=Periophthalmus magnuspinnatus TaxID=409849 RepID=UPI00145AF731|nr:mucosa-associated lymphoid tissue lymphoma translocation protein 1 isoform X2 [Periophthalmus magnuspinnatus]